MVITFQAILHQNIGIIITKTNNQQGVLLFRRPNGKNDIRDACDYFRVNLGKQHIPYIDNYIEGNIYNIIVDIHGITNDVHYAINFWTLVGIKLIKDPGLYKKWNTFLTI